ncbi:MAG: Transcriptional regulatory protein ZraR [Acidobacteria bacterium ADurb.Bin340]|nr:MAG: Transcriptional regulatory protein ZraR [Acidobacteria bacterium ADurb.Bin340]
MSPRPPARRILLVEDEPSFRDVLQMGLEPEGFATTAVPGLAEARNVLGSEAFDAVVSDLRLKDGSGLDLLAWMKAQGLETPVVIMTAFATTETTVQALNLGAADFLTKTKNDLGELTKVLKGLFTSAPPPDTGDIRDIGDLVGVGETMRRIQALVGKIALADTTVLITGESGTGKEVVARLIQRYSERAQGPFVPVNCGALPEQLLESELFGYERGAFTGAAGAKRGLFEEAGGGIIFLDEIGEMPLPLQVKLLRVLQERRVRRLGATSERAVDVRVICATNQDLRDRVEQGRFRQDLFYRLNILHLELPPLRDRPEDLPVLAGHFLARFTRKLGKAPMSLGTEALDLLRKYSFPGNVRELENLMERCVALGSSGTIGLELFPETLVAEVQSGGRSRRVPAVEVPADGFDLEAYLGALKAYLMGRALARAEGNRTKAAKLLGISFRAYRYWLQELGGPENLGTAFPRPEDFPPRAAAEGEHEG